MSKGMLLQLDLQLFAEEFGYYDPASAYEGIEGAQIPEPAAPEGQVSAQEGQPAPEGTPIVPEGVAPVQPEQPQILDFGGRKLPANEDLTGLHKDFQEQQRYITALQDQINMFKQMTAQPQAQPQAPAQPEAPSANTADWNEETWEKFYADPNSVLGNVIEAQVQRLIGDQIQPILQERQWNNEIQKMYQQFPDFQNYVSEIQALVDQNPQYAMDGGLENAYYRAKATSAMNAPSPQQLVQDPNFVQQYVLNNEQIRSQVVNQYLQNRQQTNNQVPVQMRGANSFTPQTPESSPQTLREASRAFLKNLGQR